MNTDSHSTRAMKLHKPTIEWVRRQCANEKRQAQRACDSQGLYRIDFVLERIEKRLREERR